MFVTAKFERTPDNIRAAARGHDLVVRRHEGRAHDAGLFQATTATVALFKIAHERAILERERQARLKWQLDWSREIIPQVIVDLIGEAENFSGIKNVFRVERALDFTHYVEQRV